LEAVLKDHSADHPTWPGVPGILVPLLAILSLLVFPGLGSAQSSPPGTDGRIYGIATAGSPERLEADIRTLAGFGTRNTLSDTLSDTRGIGAARRWIKAEMDRIAADCDGCMEVFYTEKLFTPEMTRRIPEPVNVVNVVGVIRGTRFPDRYVVMSADIDSRATRGTDV
jgi:hypothetical protein